MNYYQLQDFNSYNSFVGFQPATGLKAPKLAAAYNHFRDFTLQYIKDNGFAAITEAFEAWSKINLID